MIKLSVFDELLKSTTLLSYSHQYSCLASTNPEV